MDLISRLAPLEGVQDLILDLNHLQCLIDRKDE